MQVITAIISLITAIVLLIVALTNLEIWRRSRNRPPDQEPPRTPSEQELRAVGPAPSLWRRIIRRFVRWLLGGSVFVIVFGLGVAAAGLPFGGYLLTTALTSESPALRLLSPSEDSAVPNRISVELEARTLERGEFLAVLVRPLPNEPFQSYFVQQPPMQVDSDRWVSQLVVVGAPDDVPGTLFDICAIITEFELSPGAKLSDLPLGMSDCVRVTRE